jgi:hypothetical protein
MPRRGTKKARRSANRAVNEAGPTRIPGVMRSAEALSVGVVHTLTDTVVTAIRGIQKVGAEVASTAVSAVRGTIRAAGEIGGGARESATAAPEAQPPSPGAASASPSPRKPLRKADGPAKRRRRRSAA